MELLPAMSIAASGLTAERMRLTSSPTIWLMSNHPTRGAPPPPQAGFHDAVHARLGWECRWWRSCKMLHHRN